MPSRLRNHPRRVYENFWCESRFERRRTGGWAPLLPREGPFPKDQSPVESFFKVVDLPWRCWWRPSAAAVNQGENWVKTCCICCNLGPISVVWAIWEIFSSHSVQQEECLLGRSKQAKQHELDSRVLDEPMDIYHPYTFCAVFWIAGIADWQEKEIEFVCGSGTASNGWYGSWPIHFYRF